MIYNQKQKLWNYEETSNHQMQRKRSKWLPVDQEPPSTAFEIQGTQRIQVLQVVLTGQFHFYGFCMKINCFFICVKIWNFHWFFHIKAALSATRLYFCLIHFPILEILLNWLFWFFVYTQQQSGQFPNGILSWQFKLHKESP